MRLLVLAARSAVQLVLEVIRAQARPCNLDSNAVYRLMSDCGFRVVTHQGLVFAPAACCLSQEAWNQYPVWVHRIYRWGETIRHIRKKGWLNDYSVIVAQRTV